MIQLILHLVGDYITQSHWMAAFKSKRPWPCLCHCFLYTLPFLVLTSNVKALGIIFVTHYLIDRWGLARYLVWIKNWMAPNGYPRFEWCKITGYFDPEVNPQNLNVPDRVEWECHTLNKDLVRPIWLRVWLFIITDNTLHLICNALALHYYP